MMCENKSYKVFVWVAAICGLTILTIRPVIYEIDNLFSSDEWWTAKIRVLSPKEGEKPRIQYERQAERTMSGTWNAYTSSKTAERCGGSGQFNYGKINSGLGNWSWKDFIGVDCPVPEGDFKVCATWIMTDLKGQSKSFGPVCSSSTCVTGNCRDVIR